MDEKQTISSKDVGTVEVVLGKNDPILRPVSEPDGKPGPDPEPEPENPTEHYRRKKGIN